MQGICSGVGAKKRLTPPQPVALAHQGWGQSGISRWAAFDSKSVAACACWVRVRGRFGLYFLLGCWRCSCIAVSPLCPSARAEERSSRGGLVCRRTHQLGALTGRSCLSGARQRAASSAARPASEHHRLPVGAAEGTRAVGSPSFAYFSWRSKKSESPAGAKPDRYLLLL